MNKFLTIVFFGLLAAVCRSELPSDYYYDPNAEDIKSGAYVMVKGKTYPFKPPETPNIPSDVKLSDADKNVLEVMNLIAALEMEIEALAETMYDRMVMDLQFHTANDTTTITWNQSGAAGSTSKAHTLTDKTVDVDDTTIGKAGNTIYMIRYTGGPYLWGANGWEKYIVPTGTVYFDNRFVTTNDAGIITLQLKGPCENSLAEFLKNGDRLGHKILTQIPGEGGAIPHWTPIGTLGALTSVDEVSVVTNAEGHVGELAIAGFHEAEAGAIATKGENNMRWAKTGYRWHYYGTAEAGTGLGWWELPSIVTNAVVADELTIADLSEDEGVKRFGFKTYPPALGEDGTPYGAYMSEEGLEWARMPVVSNKTDNVFIVTNGEGVISLNLKGPCNTSISEMLQTGDTKGHKFLAQIQGDDGAAIPHWTPLGEILPPSGGGGAIRFIGTDGEEAVVGSGATTNSVTFASASDSNVKVSVAGSDGDVTITIGVYYK